MTLLIDLLSFIAVSAVMIKAGNYAVRSLTAMGKNLNIGPFVVSFLLIGLVSAMPESFVSIISAFEGVPSLGFGTLIGSVISDLTLFIGLVAVIAVKTKVTRGFTYELWLFSLISLLLALGFDGTLSRIDGAILAGGCMMFFYSILQQNHIVDKLMHSDKKHFARQLAVFIASASVVFVSANYIVKVAQSLAADFGIPLVIVGLIFLALATSLPEAVFAITAARKKLADVAIGELFGVIMIDASLLIGVVAIINPITIPAADITKIAIFALTSVALSMYFIRSGRYLTWKEGLVLIFFYLLFIMTELAAAHGVAT